VNSELIWSKAIEICREAIDCGAVIPLKTIKYKNTDDKNDYELRFLKSPIPNHLTEYGPKKNPFIPWDYRLQIENVNDNHTLILNKYPVQLGHMLLITNTWEPQNGWLNIEDFEAISNVDNDTTGLWFFNSSKEAGASQPHRHFQLLRRDNNELICPRYKWFCSLLNNNEDVYSKLNRSISIKARKTNNNSISNDLFNAYKSMCIDMNLGNINIHNRPLKPYNLLITKEWIALITRSKDRSYGFSINGLGFAGYFLATQKSEINILTKFGPEKILSNVVD
tara:strand:+ start:1108 stop:1947 length:840 start_codon:yes stop_codon:yes gene_type:complete